MAGEMGAGSGSIGERDSKESVRELALKLVLQISSACFVGWLRARLTICRRPRAPETCSDPRPCLRLE